MKIAVVGTRGIPNISGGVETHCEELFPRIVSKEFDITVFRRENYVKDCLSEYKGVRLVTLQSPKKKAIEALIHTVRAILYAKYKHQAAVVHIHAVGPALATPLARLLGLKVVFTHHGPDYERDKWGKIAREFLRLGERLGVRYANEVIVISRVINDLIQQKYKRMDAHIIYNGVSEPVFYTDTGYLDELKIKPKKYFFALGRFVPEKNFHQLIEAFISLKENNDYQLVIAGDADFQDTYAQKLKQMAEENGIVLTGFVKGVQLQTLWSNAYCFVLPSSHEGLPISLLEAMSYRLPVVVSNIPANMEVELSPDNYFQANNVKALTEKLQQFIDAESKQLSYSMDKYQWDRIAAQTSDVYRQLARNTKP